MNGRQQAVRVGVFVVVGVALFGVGLFLIGDRRLLFVAHEEIETSLRRVTGLQVGTRVRLAGMNAGEITAIDVPRQPSEPFVLRLRIRRDVAHLVRTDSVASVQTDGLVGNAFIQVGPGTDAAPVAAAGSRIRGTDPVELGDVLAETHQTLTSFRAFVDDISGDVTGALQSMTKTVDGINGVVDEVGSSVKTVTVSVNQSVEKGQRFIDEGTGLLAGLREGRGSVGKLLNDDALYEDLKSAARHTNQTMDHVRGTALDTRQSFERMLGPGGTAEVVLDDVRGASSAAEEVLADLAEHTEAFKRNFLVRGFFQKRGFYDIDALTPREYRRFSADRNRRTVMRIWVDAAVLFADDERGVERMTPEGRARLDLAMGTFLDQRRDSPLVVEGYATRGATSEQFVRADARARAVRNYVARQFRRDASITGAIGLASDAEGSPSGDGRWDGVALTLLVPK